MHDHNMPAPSGNHEPETYDEQGNPLDMTPLPKIDLRDAHAIRREIAAVYSLESNAEYQANIQTILSRLLGY